MLVTSRTFVVIGIGRTEPSVRRGESATRGVARRETERTRDGRALQGTVETHIAEERCGKEKEDGGRGRGEGMRARARERERERRSDFVSTWRRNERGRRDDENGARTTETESGEGARGETRIKRGGVCSASEWGQRTRRVRAPVGVAGICKWRLAVNVGTSRAPFLSPSLSFSPPLSAVVVRERAFRARSSRVKQT